MSKITKVRMNSEAAGPGGTFNTGREYEVPGQMPATLAAQFVAGGYATDLTEKAKAKPAKKAVEKPEKDEEPGAEGESDETDSEKDEEPGAEGNDTANAELDL